MEPIIAFAANGVSVIGLVAGLFWMLASGRLVTRREADGIVAAAQRETAAAYADRDMWRETAQTQAPEISKLLLESETTNRLLRGLPRISEVDPA